MMDGTQVVESKGFVKANGMKFPQNGSIMTGRMRNLLKDGKYGAPNTKNLLRVVRDGDIVVELGSGIGYASTLLTSRRKLDHIHIFEPNPALATYTQSVHAANGVENATVVNAMLGKRKASVDFFMRGNVFASSTIEVEGSEVLATEMVEVLNAKTALKDIKPTVLICALEGGEADLVPDLDLSTLRAAVIVLQPKACGPDGVNAVFKAMMDAGLAYYARGSTSKVVAFRRTW